MLAEAGWRSTRRRDLAGRLPGFALVVALPMLEIDGVATKTYRACRGGHQKTMSERREQSAGIV